MKSQERASVDPPLGLNRSIDVRVVHRRANRVLGQSGLALLVGIGSFLLGLGGFASYEIAQSSCLQLSPVCAAENVRLISQSLYLAYGLAAVGVVLLGGSIGAHVIGTRGRAKSVAPSRANPPPFDPNHVFESDRGSLRQQIARPVVYLSVIFATGVVVAGAVVTPTVLVTFLDILPSPLVANGGSEQIIVSDNFGCVANGPATIFPSTCGNTMFVGKEFVASFSVGDLSATGCNVTGVTLGNGFQVTSVTPSFPLYVPPENSTGFSAAVAITLTLQTPSRGGSYVTVGGSLFLTC